MGRPRNPVTPAGNLTKALQKLPLEETDFPHFRRATLRAVLRPEEILYKKSGTNAKDAHYEYRYTSQEIGEILAFTWWTYCNTDVFTRPVLRAAATVLSPLRLYSSAMLASITGIPQDTVTKAMLKIPGAPTMRVLGTCSIGIVHKLLTTAAEGEEAYREEIRELALDEAAPPALLARISGVPKLILKRPNRGINFFPQECDFSHGVVLDSHQAEAYARHYGKEAKPYEANPGNQGDTRDLYAGTPLDSLHHTSAPVPDGFDHPAHLAIPGLPSACDSADPQWSRRIDAWSDRYGLLAAPGPRHHVPCRCP